MKKIVKMCFFDKNEKIITKKEKKRKIKKNKKMKKIKKNKK